MKKMWEAALDRQSQALEAEAGMGGGRKEGGDRRCSLKSASYWHQTQNSPLLSIIMVLYYYYKGETAICWAFFPLSI